MEKKLATVNDVANKEFDFVIIGGGTAGCVIASRLSEDPSVSVAVLEASPAHLDDPIRSDPMGWLKHMLDPEYDYMHGNFDPPQVRDRNPFFYHRGKYLGGTSAINWMIYNLPQREEVDAFGALGNDGWNWDSFHEYSKRVQKFFPTENKYCPEFRGLYDPDNIGHDGPLALSFSRTASGVEAPFQKALEKHGVEILPDTLGGKVCGSMKSLLTYDPVKNERADAFKGYLSPALDRPNLKVLTEAFVRRINTNDGPNGVIAQSVTFEYGGKVYEVFVKKEAIVCCGTVQSPQILELSGIGDPKILEPLNISVKVDLPGVGSNVQERFAVPSHFFVLRDDSEHFLTTTDMLAAEGFDRKIQDRHPGIDVPWKIFVDGLSFMPVALMTDKLPEIIERQRAQLAEVGHTYPPGRKEQHELQLKILEDPNIADTEIILFPVGWPFPLKEIADKPYVLIISIFSHPFSRGTIHITSADPKAAPQISPNYFQQLADLEVMSEMVKWVSKVTETEPFKSLVAHEAVPGTVFDVTSDESLEKYIRGNVSSSWHTASSCSMLPRDKNGVVDNKLKVHGTSNIRVADLSIIPLQTAVHPQGTVYTVAEIAADIIKKQYKTA